MISLLDFTIRCRCQSKQIMKKQTRKKKKRVTVSYKCELRVLPSLALLALLLSVCRSFKALYWQRSVLCSAVHVVVQCSGVHCRDGGRSKICGGGEGQAVIKSSFDEIYILLLCRPISGKGRKAETAPLFLLAFLAQWPNQLILVSFHYFDAPRASRGV